MVGRPVWYGSITMAGITLLPTFTFDTFILLLVTEYFYRMMLLLEGEYYIKYIKYIKASNGIKLCCSAAKLHREEEKEGGIHSDAFPVSCQPPAETAWLATAAHLNVCFLPVWRFQWCGFNEIRRRKVNVFLLFLTCCRRVLNASWLEAVNNTGQSVLWGVQCLALVLAVSTNSALSTSEKTDQRKLKCGSLSTNARLPGASTVNMSVKLVNKLLSRLFTWQKCSHRAECLFLVRTHTSGTLTLH